MRPLFARPLFQKSSVPMAIAILAGLSATGMPFSAAMAAEPIGKAEKIENRVTGLAGGQNRTLGVPDAVHRDETIRTEAKAQAQLRFSDESDLRLGPDAAIKLDAFVFSGKKDSAMELVQGTMRFVSGNGPKGSYLIKTPVATIGLRGTTVEITIRQGRTYVSLHEGQAQVCTRTGRCMEIANACTYLSVDNRGVTLPQPLSNRVPTFSGQCSGEFCVQDSCSPQLSGAPGATPPAVRPPRLTPPKVTPPKVKLPRPRRAPVVEDEYDVEEPVYLPPRGTVIVPGFPIDPGFIRPGRPGRWPDGRPPGGRPPSGRPPAAQPPKGEGYPFPGRRPTGPGITRQIRPQFEAPVRPGIRGGDNFMRRGRGGFDIR